MYRQWKQEQVSWEGYRAAAQLCRDGVRKAKVWMELNLARDAKTSKKGFYSYVSQKRKVKEHYLSIWTSVRPLTQSPTTFFTLNWREMGLMGELFSG